MHSLAAPAVRFVMLYGDKSRHSRLRPQFHRSPTPQCLQELQVKAHTKLLALQAIPAQQRLRQQIEQEQQLLKVTVIDVPCRRCSFTQLACPTCHLPAAAGETTPHQSWTIY